MIYCVEDDASIRDIEVYALQASGFETQGFEDGLSFYQALSKKQPQLVILDVMLPKINGIELLKKMKGHPQWSKIPVIMATAKGEEYDKVIALDLGADYYLTKPFGVMEFISCVKAVLRHYQKCNEEMLTCGGLKIECQSRRVTANGEKINLTYKEFELLQLFMSHPNLAYSRQQLMESVWDTDFLGETRTIDMHIKTLRKKLGVYGENIITVRNVGYRWENKNE
ncbi:MAG: response regulator transcription factor [Erysipelotrichia bacterium]|nr:response regulator transcription factor [Erysipelotrichia bacterium]